MEITDIHSIACFTFKFHIHGTNPEYLYLYMSGTSGKEYLWHHSHKHEDKWFNASVEIIALTGKLQFISSGKPGVFAIDDIRLEEGQCPDTSKH